jgi:hypothetical protein
VGIYTAWFAYRGLLLRVEEKEVVEMRAESLS